ncbi:MAG: DUF4255 domain-containing protein [Terriglobia bacterium]
MSNSLAIATVTATLRNLLMQGVTADLPGTSVTTSPLDKARDGNDNGNQINLFLYQTVFNAAWRNMDMPRQVKPGETGQPPLPLTLYYLITAYGQNDDDTLSHRLLGRTMNILHDHPVLGAAEIEAALPGNDLHEQVERVRITPEPLSLDDMSKLWNAFQTQYRISAAYQVSVVLIESSRLARTPLPVLTRGPGDEGVTAQPDLMPPFPTLESVRAPNQQPSARLGDVLTISGHHLDSDAIVVRFMNPRLAAAIEVPPLPGPTSTEITVQLPDDPANWPAGFYTLAAVISRAGQVDRTTNELPFALAPRITTAPPITVARNAAGDASITLTCSPQVRSAQRAALLLGDREVLAQSHPVQTDTLTFLVTAAPVGEHLVRLRVDGVDSLLVDRTVTPPVFDPTQKVTIS